jgi:uncharacterized membrane protein (DUF2068 family)
MTQTLPTSSPVRERRHIRTSEKWIVAIGVLHLLKAMLFFLLGIGALKLLHKDLMDVATHFIVDLRFDPEGKFVNLVLDKLSLIDTHRLKQISIVIFAYASLDAIEGVGLVMRKRWAEYITLALTASFLPWELYEIIRHVTWLKIGLTLINLAVVVYLAIYVRMKVREQDQEETSG